MIHVVMVDFNRRKYAEKALEYLCDALSNVDHEIVIVTDNDDDYNVHIPIKTIVEKKKETFSKSEYINIGIEWFDSFDDGDWFLQIDSDIILNPNTIISIIQSHNGKECQYHVLGGIKLSTKSTEIILTGSERIPYRTIETMPAECNSISENIGKAYVGNILISKVCFDKLKQVLDSDTLYNNQFIGFGGEDSVLSILSTEMSNRGIVKKEYHFDAWRHMKHERACEMNDFDKAQYEKNVSLMKELIQKGKERMNEIY